MILKNSCKLRCLILFYIVFISHVNHAFAFSLIRDDELETTISKMINPLFKAASIPSHSINIYIVDDPTINAFVLGGQNIFINTGLIEFSENPETLIGVIAHELGHITGGHLIAQKANIELLNKKMFLNIAAGFLAAKSANSTDAGMGTFLAMNEADKRMFLKYNRQQESEADNAALKYLQKTGTSSEGLVELLKHLSQQQKIFHSDMDPYLSTHPVSDERISNIKSSPPSKKTDLLPLSLRHQYSRVSAKIKAWTSDEPIKTLANFRGKDATSNYARSICNFRLNNFNEAINDLNLAIEQEPKNPYFFEQLAQYYFETGKLEEANKYYDIAHRLAPKSISISLGHALSLITAKTKSFDAINELESVQNKEPYNILAWHLLGLAYKLNNDEVNSSLAFAKEAILKEDVSTARKLIKSVSHKHLGKKEIIRLNDINLELDLLDSN